MTNEELQEIINNPNGISAEDLDRVWEDMKACDKQREAEWDALPEAEKKRLEKELSDPFYERISENPLGDDDDDD